MEPKYLSFRFGDEGHPLLILWRERWAKNPLGIPGKPFGLAVKPRVNGFLGFQKVTGPKEGILKGHLACLNHLEIMNYKTWDKT